MKVGWHLAAAAALLPCAASAQAPRVDPGASAPRGRTWQTAQTPAAPPGRSSPGQTTPGQAAPGQAAPGQTTVVLPDIEVVGATPVQGSGLDPAKIPTTSYVLTRPDLMRDGPTSALRALTERIGGVARNDAQANPFQPNLLYRGFEASPLVGNPQGLAVYVNGTRFNLPFGDTVNWDLIPDVAIERIELAGSNPAFGLNALGGSIAVQLRDGFSFQGGEAEAYGGSFGRRALGLQYGQRVGNVAAYVALSGLEENGWRRRSPSRLRQIYGDLGWRGERSEVHLSLLGASNHLTGNGTAPVELLAVDRSAVFTYPDSTRNSYGQITLSGTHRLNDAWSLQGNLYYRNLSQRTENADVSEAEACESAPGLLCLDDDGPRLTDRARDPIRDFLAGGTYANLNRTGTDTNGFGGSVQATRAAELFGRPNRLVVGASYDGGRSLFSASTRLGELTLDRTFGGPGITVDQDGGPISPVRVRANNDYYGVYISDALDVTDALTLTLSGRLNVADIRLRDRIGTSLSGNHSYARFNPAAGATYQILPTLSAYAGYAEANRTPTPAELSCADPASPCTLTNFFVADPALKQVVARTYEAGLRGRQPIGTATVDWHAGLFRADSSNDIYFAASEFTGRGYFRNIGETRRQGVEAGFTLRAGSLRAYVDYAFTEATFQSPLLLDSPQNPAADANGQIQVRPGNRLPGVPAHLVKFGASYDVTDAWTIGFTALASSGRVLRGDEANLTARTDPFVVVNLNTTYRVARGVEVFGLVQNLFDAKYENFGAFSPTGRVFIALAPGASNPRSLSPAPPIAGFGGVRVRF